MTSRVVRWLYNPDVVSAINLLVLRQQFLKLEMQSGDLELFIDSKATAGYSLFDHFSLKHDHFLDLSVTKANLGCST